MDKRVNIFRCKGIDEIKKRLAENLEGYTDILPANRDALILLKPNLNSNMNALTGNTTDLRVMAGVLEFLKSRGYNNVVIGEGTNSGYYRNNINVISRLMIDRLASYYGFRVIDFNCSEKTDIDFENGIKAGVARECFEADFFINMPKLKTHFEVGMSICLKNLMGCLVGQENKKKTHKNLARNILNINKRLKPHLHIVDGLISMEGLGPTRGTPVNTGLIIIGTDPYLIDLICGRIAEFNYKKVSTLRIAEEKGLLTPEHHRFTETVDLSMIKKKFQEPIANPFASFIHSPKRQRYFLAIRNARFFSYLASTKLFGNLLFWTGLRQDNFIKEEMRFEGFALDKDKCKDGCTRCSDYCPIGLKLPHALEERKNGCIGCQYCFLVCPTKAIEFKGTLGFMAEQIRQYDIITRRIA